jgi:hypothetical protein
VVEIKKIQENEDCIAKTYDQLKQDYKEFEDQGLFDFKAIPMK